MKKVYIYFNDYNQDKLLGYLYIDNIKGSEIYSFEYAESAIINKLTNIIQDDEIQPILGRQFKSNSKEIYGFLKDCCPDRWGRNLIRRNEAIIAKLENRKPRQLLESDYLLNISDYSRMGALRFKLDPDGEYLGNQSNEVPPLVFLSKLENAAYDKELDDEDIQLLLSPGSSLGGSRPKATIKDSSNNIWLAKFPNKDDDYDISGYEMVANDLAKLIGLNVPETKLTKLSNHGYTFLVKRFDRDKENRFFYASFMTLLNATDGESSDYSYLDIVSKLRELSSNPKEDLLELFKRVALSIIIHNHDDHLRNHGMLLKDKKWTLAPIFDINPTYETNNLSLSIDGFDSSYSLKTLLNTSKFYMIEEKEGQEIINKIIEIVRRNFLNLCEKYRLPNFLNKTFYNELTLKIE